MNDENETIINNKDFINYYNLNDKYILNRFKITPIMTGSSFLGILIIILGYFLASKMIIIDGFIIFIMLIFAGIIVNEINGTYEGLKSKWRQYEWFKNTGLKLTEYGYGWTDIDTIRLIMEENSFLKRIKNMNQEKQIKFLRRVL